MPKQQNSIFTRPLWVALFALTAAVAWGWAYPLIKIGFAEYQIQPSMTSSKILFAGIRFLGSGLILLLIAKATHREFRLKRKNSWGYLLIFTLLNTTFHYAFFYIGLSNSDGARAAILNSIGVFILVLVACMIFPTDKLSLKKIIGCVMGFAGILALNLGNVGQTTFTLLGDGMIVLNALCSASASLLTRGLTKHVDIFVGTGYSLGLGGFLLVIYAVLNDASFPQVTLLGCWILLLLIFISSLGFALYNKLIICNPIGKVAIYNSLIPIVGVLTSCLCLNEPFYSKYIIAGLLASFGIYLINRGK